MDKPQEIQQKSTTSNIVTAKNNNTKEAAKTKINNKENLSANTSK
jgi:hypothetical protein